MAGPPVLDPPATGTVSHPADSFAGAWDLFVQMLVAVARVRSEEGGGPAIAASWAAALLPTLQRTDALRAALDDADSGLVAQLTDEMFFYTWAYRSADPRLADQIPHTSQVRDPRFARDPASHDAVDDAETIIGSIEKFLDRLPAPLKKYLHGVLEVLKLTRGMA